MADPRVANFAKVLVEHSARVVPGDRVLIEATTAAEPLVKELYIQILEKGGHPHPLISFPGMMPFNQDEMYLTYAKEAQLDFIPTFYKIAYDQFESRIRVHSATNTRGTTNIDPARAQRRSKALSSITESQMRRGAEGAELTFNRGRVEVAKAEKNEAYLIKMLESDAGSRHLGEYAIGTNFDIYKFTGNILFDEKIGGTFHMALGAGYPETGSRNKSSIHWDMICDLRTDSEILVDGELFYKNGQFVFGG